MYVDDAALLKATTTSAKEKGVLNGAEDATVVNNTNKNGNGKAARIGPDEQYTSLSNIDPMLDEIKIKGWCISVWHTHPAGKPNEAYTLDMVLQDEHVCLRLFFPIDNCYKYYSILNFIF